MLSLRRGVNFELETLAFFEAHIIVFEHAADTWQKTTKADIRQAAEA